jgi:serine/threonine-protein kinase
MPDPVQETPSAGDPGTAATVRLDGAIHAEREPRSSAERVAVARATQAWGKLGLDPDKLTPGSGGTLSLRRDPGASLRADEALRETPVLCPGGDAAGEIRLDTLLGQGGMGTVHLAKQCSLRRDVAVKRLRAELAQTDSAVRSLVLEGYVLGALEHPNVCPVHVLGRDAHGLPMLVLKRVEGREWREHIGAGRLTAPEGAGDPLDWHLSVLVQVCNAVHFAHSRGIVHRDLKPDNVMVGGFGEIYVMDWGLAAGFGDERVPGLVRVEEIRDIAGTPEYLAPEMVLCEGARIGPRTDVYLLGACLHEILTLTPRHTGATLRAMLYHAIVSAPVAYGAEVPAELAAIANKATAADPSDRYASADELRQALAAATRHLHSERLAREAIRRGDRLGELVRGGRRGAEVEIYRLFGECRFAFGQALREWSDNDLARRGLQEVLEQMIGFELERRGHAAAKLLLAELPQPNRALADRVAELGRALAAERGELSRLRHERDPRVARAERRRFMLIGGVALLCVYLLLGRLHHHSIYTAQYPALMSVNLAYGLGLGLATLKWRSVLTETEANRSFLWALWMAFFTALVTWSLCWVASVPVAVALGAALMLYAAAALTLARATDPRIMPAVVPFFLGAVALVRWPEWRYELMGASLCAAMLTAAAFWRGAGVPPSGTARA